MTDPGSMPDGHLSTNGFRSKQRTDGAGVPSSASADHILNNNICSYRYRLFHCCSMIPLANSGEAMTEPAEAKLDLGRVTSNSASGRSRAAVEDR